jgi:hypothetical protein
VAFLGAGTLGADGPPTLETALSRIRRNVRTFETQIPDFVCQERITSRNIAEKDNRLEKQTVIESVFSGRQKHSAVNLLVGTSFTEERQIESINDQPSGGSALPAGVFHVSGGYTSLLVLIFGPGSEANYVFSLGPAAPAGPPGAIAIAFSSRSGRQKIVEKDGLHSYKAAGKAWFDPVSFEILRIEERIQPKGGELGGELPVVVEYQPVRIGESQFYLPSRVSATARRTVAGKAERGEFTAEYSDYRKYGSSTSIQFPDAGK